MEKIAMLKMFKTWQMNRKIARWEQITVMLGHGVLATKFQKLVNEQARLNREIGLLEEELALGYDWRLYD